MKLGTETNSLVNHLCSRQTIGEPEPVVGMGVTFLGWTDRNPGTIVEINHAKRYIVATHDDYRRIDGGGISESQQYSFTSRPDGIRSFWRKGKNGQWRECRFNDNGRLVFAGGAGLLIGSREKYHDFCF
jgi:hypothetical protein